MSPEPECNDVFDAGEGTAPIPLELQPESEIAVQLKLRRSSNGNVGPC